MYNEVQDMRGCIIEHVGDTDNTADERLFGYVLHASPLDAVNQVCFDIDNFRPRQVHARRAGRPEKNWVVESLSHARSRGCFVQSVCSHCSPTLTSQSRSRSPPFQ